MDLGSEYTQKQESHVDDDNDDIKTNGLSTIETEKLSSSENVDTHGLPDGTDQTGVDIDGQVKFSTSFPSSVKSPSGGSPPVSKGYGLKKWKRIRRDSVSDSGAIADGGKILKREFSDSQYPKNSISPPGNVKPNSDNSSGSANMSKSGGDSRFAVGPAFVPGTDSENSEDRSSKSSTAASVPNMRSELSSVPNKLTDLSGKSVGISAQRAGKGIIEISKKPRGERVKIEKENSHSSVESDSRSSQFVFMQGSFSGASNSKPSGTSMNNDGENSLPDDVAEDSSWEDKDEKSESDQQTDGCDPLVESMRNFQSVQEALEKEIQKFGEIGKEYSSLNHSSINDPNLPEDFNVTEPEIHKLSHLRSEKIKQNPSSSLETQVISLKQDVKYYESKLDETKAVLELKTSRVTKLEASLNTHEASKEKVGSAVYLQQECRDLENELENLFLQKIEAGIEYLVLTRTIPNLRLFEEQKAIAEEQRQTLNKLGDTQTKARTVKKQVENMEKDCGSIIDSEEVLQVQRRVYKATSRFCTQFVLLLLVLWLFVDQLSPRSGLVVPT